MTESTMTLHDNRIQMLHPFDGNHWTNLMINIDTPQPTKQDYNNHQNELSPDPAYFYYEPGNSPQQIYDNSDNFWAVYKDLCTPKQQQHTQDNLSTIQPTKVNMLCADSEINDSIVMPSNYFVSSEYHVEHTSEPIYIPHLSTLQNPTVSYTIPEDAKPVYHTVVENMIPPSSLEKHGVSDSSTFISSVHQETGNSSTQDHIEQIPHNPIITSLHTELLNDCSSNAIPFSLLQTPKEQLPLAVRQRMLQLRFMTIKAKQHNKAASLQNFYHIQAANIEGERNKELKFRQDTPWLQTGLNSYYDFQHHSLISRVEQSVGLLEEYSPTVHNKEQHSTPLNFNIESHQRKRITPRDNNNRFVSTYNPVAVRIMSNWYDRNVNHPYPSNDTCEIFAKAGSISIEQVKKWFANRRMRERNTKSLGQIAKERKIRKRTISGETVLDQGTKRQCTE